MCTLQAGKYFNLFKQNNWSPTLGVHGLLASQLFQHLGGTSQSVTRLAHTDVEAELANTQLPHGVLGLLAPGFVLVLQ
jgi:hypothetical protein